MISAINNSPAFKGIVPIRVFVDGHETLDPKLVRSASRQLTAALIQPQKTQSKAIAELFSKFDPQYKKGGYPEKSKPSDFFRCLIDRRGNFLATGEQALLVNKLGKDIGKEKQVCHERRIHDSLDLIIAKKKYGHTISQILTSTALRLKNAANSMRPVTLNINMKSNGKYGLSSFKMQLSDILFTP